MVKSPQAQWLVAPRLLAETGTKIMPRISVWILSAVLLATPAVLAQSKSVKHHKSHKAPKPLVLPPLPPGPLRQLPMNDLPPNAAKVSYQGGLLSISANNATLSQILGDVRRLTGASIEIPQNAGERVIADLGPGSPRDVLAGLLNGTSFNYVMLGTESDATAVSSLILTPKPSANGETQTAAVYQNNPMPQQNIPQPAPFRQDLLVPKNFPPPNAAQAQPDEAADDSKDDEENADDNADDQGQGQPGQPGVADGQQDPNQPNAGPRTPEQMLEMMRRQQQGQSPFSNSVIPSPQPPQQ